MIKKLTLVSVVLATVVSLTRGEDNYLHFIKNAPEFQRVPQERDVMIGRWDTWIYMPWRYRWAIGTGDEGGRFCRDYGFNGGFTDHGHGPFEWLNKWNLRFYNDHTAAKGYLYLHRGSGKRFLAKFQRDGRAIRSGTDGPRPLDEAMLDKLKGIVTRYVTNVKQNSSLRVAYALDDEISWGSFVVPIPWLDQYKATNLEIGGAQGLKMVGSRWIHDGVAIYYSHPSIQVSWCLDIEPHGSTWVNRGSDHRLGTSHNVRKAWEYLLTDSGIQYSFIPYDEVVVHGVPDEYKVLILPACYALSDMEAQRIAEFCRRGGTVIADFAGGLFDQHGKRRAAGALDELFGVTHDGSETARDFFGDRLWVETDQDAGFSYRHYRDLFATIDCKLEDGYAVAEKKLPTQVVRTAGSGKAVFVNLSPQRYLQYREEGTATDELRQVFMQHVATAGVQP